jgi:hypothetical protein
MQNAKRKMRTCIKGIILSCLIFQTAAVSSQEFTMPSFVHAIDACDMDMDGSVDIIVYARIPRDGVPRDGVPFLTIPASNARRECIWLLLKEMGLFYSRKLLKSNIKNTNFGY